MREVRYRISHKHNLQTHGLDFGHDMVREGKRESCELCDCWKEASVSAVSLVFDLGCISKYFDLLLFSILLS